MVATSTGEILPEPHCLSLNFLYVYVYVKKILFSQNDNQVNVS